LPGWAQRAVVQGIVTDSLQQPLVGATISLPDNAGATATNVRGRFQLSVPSGKAIQLTIRYIGYAAAVREVSLVANETRFLTIELSQTANLVQEVTVRG